MWNVLWLTVRGGGLWGVGMEREVTRTGSFPDVERGRASLGGPWALIITYIMTLCWSTSWAALDGAMIYVRSAQVSEVY